jgi:hypothetical protein
MPFFSTYSALTTIADLDFSPQVQLLEIFKRSREYKFGFTSRDRCAGLATMVISQGIGPAFGARSLRSWGAGVNSVGCSYGHVESLKDCNNGLEQLMTSPTETVGARWQVVTGNY